MTTKKDQLKALAEQTRVQAEKKAQVEAQQKAQAEQKKHMDKVNKRFNKCLAALSGLKVEDCANIANAIVKATSQAEYIYRND